jgi:peptidoglycan/LPS O-acetylase OafA/YrhL
MRFVPVREVRFRRPVAEELGADRDPEAQVAEHRVTAPSRIPQLDGLRAIAILLVLVTHFWSYPAGFEPINRLARTGWAGVDLFFVLSGFLITRILLDARDSPRYYRDFFARRVLRIFPPYYALLGVVFILLPLHGTSPELQAVVRDWPLYVGYLANVALVLHGWQLFPLDITWSLAIEEQFYILWPFVVRRLPLRGLLLVLAGMVVVVPLIRTVAWLGLGVGWMATHMLTFFRLDSLAMGGLVALALRRGLLGGPALRRVALSVLAMVGPLLLLLIETDRFRRDSLLAGTIGYSLLAIFFGALLVCCLLAGSHLPRLLSSPALRRIGVVSYGIYIVHPLCFLVVGAALAKLGVDVHHLTGSPLANAGLALLIFSISAYVLAELSFRYFERPILVFKERFRSSAPELKGGPSSPLDRHAEALGS